MYRSAFLPCGFVILSLAIAPFLMSAVVSLPESSPDDSPLFSTTPADFAGTSRPPSRISGGSRGPCLNQLIAIVPGTNAITLEADCSAKSNSLLALTLDEFPTFWVYVPRPRENSVVGAQAAAELVILNERQQPIQTERIMLPTESGIISVKLSQSLPANQPYRWIFSVRVNPHSPSQNPRVEGLIQRIQPNVMLRNQFAEATSEQDRIALYAEHNLWHDWLTALATIEASSNSDAADLAWSNLLDSVGLGAIADVPILGCCSTANAVSESAPIQ